MTFPARTGSDGDVYHVINDYLGNEVALKLLAPKAGQPATWDEASTCCRF